MIDKSKAAMLNMSIEAIYNLKNTPGVLYYVYNLTNQPLLPTGIEITDDFYLGRNDYNYDLSNPCYAHFTLYEPDYCRHFAQLLWKDSKSFGCAYIIIGVNYNLFCYYDPPGNEPSQYRSNVPIIYHFFNLSKN